MAEHHDRKPLFDLFLEEFQLSGREIIVDVVHRHKIHAVNRPRTKRQVIRKRTLDPRITLRFVRGILFGFAHILAEFMISGRKKNGFSLEFFMDLFQIQLTHEVDQVPRMEEKQIVFLCVRKVRVKFFLGVSKISGTRGRELPFPLVFALIRKTEMGIRNMKCAKRLLQPDFDLQFPNIQRIHRLCAGLNCRKGRRKADARA